ncbi:MAG: GDP-L-fucose synthase [Deltaproteobacteria bacterium]|nr:GDP-L-fucose synthase [Deltaproteobacteria bacterium]
MFSKGKGDTIATYSRIYIAGHRGLVGSAITRRLQATGHTNLILKTSTELDLRDQGAVMRFFEETRPEYVFLAAAKVGGILANSSYPADFIYDNLAISINVIHAAYGFGVRRLLFLGSSCIYPRECPQPIREEYLLTGPLESTNEPYAVAKIAGLKLCQAYARQHGCNFFSIMPTNLYGPGDNFNLETSHVLPAILRKFHEAKLSGHTPVTLWGTGKPRREFLHVDDLADACIFSMSREIAPGNILNVGTGKDISIEELAKLIQEIVGHQGEILWDRTKPDGTLSKLLDVSKFQAMGWKARIGLRNGIAMTYEYYQKQPGVRAERTQ